MSNIRRLLSVLATSAIIAGGLGFASPAWADVVPYPSDGPGSVTVARSATTLEATPVAWPDDSDFAFRWYRGTTAATATTAATGAGSTTASYTPNSADANQFLRVRVTATNAVEFTGTATRYSSAKNYSIVVTNGGASVVGDAVAGNVVHLEWAELTQFSSAGDALTAAPLLTSGYQWLRNGSSISGATSATYTLTNSDIGTQISARATATAPATSPTKITSFPTAVEGRVIEGSHDQPTVTKTVVGASIRLALLRTVGDITESGVALTYRWYRDTTAISGATKTTYTLTSADRGKLISIHVSVKKTGYATVPLASVPTQYSVTASTVPTVTGNARVGEYLESHGPGWLAPGPDVQPTYQWYRNGVAISGANAKLQYYEIQSADYAKKITVRVTGTRVGYLSYLGMSAPTSTVAKGQISGFLQPYVEWSGRTLTAGEQTTIYTPDPVYTYQWYRNGVAISGATGRSYTYTSADYAKDLTFRIKVSRTNFEPFPPATLQSPYSVSLLTNGLPVIVGDIRVGGVLSIELPQYRLEPFIEHPTSFAYVWYRDGKPISGARSATYTATSADKGKKITVKVTAYDLINDGGVIKELLPAIRTSKSTQALGTYAFAQVAVPNVARVGDVLTSNGPGVSPLPDGATVARQWYRGDSAISGATSASYTLKAADAGKQIYIRFVITKSGYTTLLQYSARTIY